MPDGIVLASPPRVVPGASVTIAGAAFPTHPDGPPRVRVGAHDARVVSSSPRVLRFTVPADAERGRQPVILDDRAEPVATVDVGVTLVTGVHQVDSPVFDRAGRLYATQSGSRDTKVPVPIYRVDHGGVREPLAVEIANPTSLAIGPSGDLFVSSRFEGHVYRVKSDSSGHTAEIYATELGVPTGLAFAPDGTLYVGDRSGSILRVSAAREVETWAQVPSSIAAFHLAYGPDGCLYVTAPTLATHDALYRITPARTVDVVTDVFGRPQGLAFDASGALHVVDALAGSAALYRVDVSAAAPVPQLVAAAPRLVGVAFDADGRMALASNDTIWLFSDGLSRAD